MKTSYNIYGRDYEVDGSLDTIKPLNPDTAYFFPLPQMGSIRVIGDTASDFLQGQLTCDLREVNEKAMRAGAQCNVKGRVEALVDVIYWEGFYRMLLPQDLIPHTMKSLNKIALVSRVRLVAESDFCFYGLHLPSDAVLPFDLVKPNNRWELSANAIACCYALGGNDFMLITPALQKDNCEKILSAWCVEKTALQWHYCQLLASRMQIYKTTQGQFLPHRLALDKQGYISFNKGCYKGQEIVARMHYLSKKKHQLRLFNTPTLEAAKNYPDMDELIDYCPTANGFLILASIRLSQT